MSHEDLNKRVSQLIEWLSSSDGFFINKNIEIFDNTDVGRGVRLKNGKLCTNEEVVSIPSSHQLNFHTILYHMSIFNPDIKIDGIIPDSHGLRKYCDQNSDKGVEDPRSVVYKTLDQAELLELSSFQLLCIYILTEWVLLPCWSGGKIESWWQPFFAVFPSPDELEAIPTILSLNNLQEEHAIILECLSESSKEQTKRISSLVVQDWFKLQPIINNWRSMFLEPIPDDSDLFQRFIHIYFIINSRCLYLNIPLKPNPIDHLTMVPYVDFLNHSNDVNIHCGPKVDRFKKAGYGLGKFSIVVGSHQYLNPLEEIFLNYGAHSNDFLLNEYGFTTKDNSWNFIDITGIVTSLFEDEEQILFLKRLGYWGEYTISNTEISYRALVALALYCTKDYRRTEKFAHGIISETFFWPKIKPVLVPLLNDMKLGFETRISTISNLQVSERIKLNLLQIYEDYLEIIRKYLL